MSGNDIDHLAFLENLTDSERSIFLTEYNSVRRNPTAGVLLALFLGGIGAHRLYLNDKKGYWYLGLCWLLWPAIIAFFEAFSMGQRVRIFNRMKARSIAEKITAQRPSSDASPAMRLCPFCAEEIRAQARICKHCHSNVSQEPLNLAPSDTDS